MYTKKLLSAAAAMAVLSSGAIAFDSYIGDASIGAAGTGLSTSGVGINTTNASGTSNQNTDINGSLIVTEFDPNNDGKTRFVLSSYQRGDKATNAIIPSSTFKGNALIYPAFNQTDGWGTEIVVRNVTNKAIVAKAVLYSGEDSHEVVDFNIYLSAKDVCRFKIEGNKITSTDGSIKTYGINPHQAFGTSKTTGDDVTRDLTDYALIKFANDSEHPFNFGVTEKTGYVVIYGMEESNGIRLIEKKTDSNASTAVTPNGFHNDHAGLYAAYARSLDDERNGWRTLTNPSVGGILNGMFVASSGVTQAPDINTSVTGKDVTWLEYVEGENTLRERTATFKAVANNSLTGQVRIYNTSAGRDMLLNATAVNNFNDNNNPDGNLRMLWTEGEYASIADRCIEEDNNITHSTGATTTDTITSVFYDKECVVNDAKQFNIRSAVYTYANASAGIENKILITQPYKRLLAQLGNPAVGYNPKYNGTSNTKVVLDLAKEKYQKVATGTSYDFRIAPTPYDEDEQTSVQAIAGTIITSPATTGSSVIKFNKELQEINADNMEKNPGFNGAFDNKNGFVEFTVPVSAITTQMVGSVAGSSAEMNWVYTDNNK